MTETKIPTYAVGIQFPHEHDSFSEITLNGELLLIRFTYNDTFDYWTFGIYELNREPIVAAVKIVPNFPLNLFLSMRRLDGMADRRPIPRQLGGGHVGKPENRSARAAGTDCPKTWTA